MGVKMVMSGEGADETLAGYLYFHKAPNPQELHEELVRKVEALHTFDCLRANKATMAHGLEARVPFLDREVLDVVMRTHPEYKMYKKGEPTQFVEKWLLRAAFDDEEMPYLPKEVLWRQKEQFSDGVGYSWIDGSRPSYFTAPCAYRTLRCARIRAVTPTSEYGRAQGARSEGGHRR